MRRNRKSITTSLEIVKNIAELTKMNFNLLTKLMPWLDANEKVQRKFRCAVFVRLSRIEVLAAMIHAAQIVEAQGWQPGYQERVKKQTENFEQYLAMHSHQLGLEMVRYVYGESEEPARPRDRRRKWSDWEI